MDTHLDRMVSLFDRQGKRFDEMEKENRTD